MTQSGVYPHDAKAGRRPTHRCALVSAGTARRSAEYRPDDMNGRYGLLGLGLLIGALASIGVDAFDLTDRWMGPTGERLLTIADTVGLPAALCLLGVVLLLFRDGRRHARAIARWLATGMGVVLLGLTATGLVGTIELALPQHSRPAILKVMDASSYAVSYLTILAVGGCFFVLGLARRGEPA